MNENTSLLQKRRTESEESRFFVELKVKVAQVAILVTITLEKVAFYGLVGNLVFFLNKNPFEWKSYNSVYALFFFFGISYLASFLGGLVADTLLGRFKTLLFTFVLYLTGYSFLPFLGGQNNNDSNSHVKLPKICGYGQNITNELQNESPFDEYCASLLFGVLTLIAVGSGPFRSNIAPFGADQVKGEGQQACLTFFNWYYWCVNLGSLIALLGVTFIQQEHGFHLGYLTSLICLAVAAFVFLCGSFSYVYRPRTGSVIKNLFKVVWEAATLRRFCFSCKECCGRQNDRHSDTTLERPTTCLDYAKYRYGGSFQETTVDEVKKVLKVVCVFLTLIPYWMVYFQMETTFLIQGLHMNLNWPGWNITKTVNCGPQNASDSEPVNIKMKTPIVAAWFSVVDIVFVIILIPVFDRLIYPRLARARRPMGFVLRVSIGMLVAAMAVCVAGVVEHYRLESIYPNISTPCCRHTVEQTVGYTTYDAAEMSIFWQIPQYALIGLSEVFASVAALEFAYQMAPKSAKGFIMGLFYLFIGIGSFFGVASVELFEDLWFGHYDNGNINCRVPCTGCNASGGNCNIQRKCHLDYYYFFLAGVEVVGLFLFLIVVKLCQVQKEISTVVHNKTEPQPQAENSGSGLLRSPLSVGRQVNT